MIYIDYSWCDIYLSTVHGVQYHISCIEVEQYPTDSVSSLSRFHDDVMMKTIETGRTITLLGTSIRDVGVGFKMSFTMLITNFSSDSGLTLSLTGQNTLDVVTGCGPKRPHS